LIIIRYAPLTKEERRPDMAKSISNAGGLKERETGVKAKSENSQRLSKVGEWMRAHPSANGANGVILDMRAVMK
jgi:hypothetical protein